MLPQKKTLYYSLITVIFLLFFGIAIVYAGSGAGYLVDDGSSYSSTESGKYPSAILVDGYPAIAYYDSNSDNLMYIRATNADGTAWGTPFVVADSVTDTYYPYTNTGSARPEMRMVNGNPAVAFYTNNNGLGYVRASDSTGSSWNDPILVDGTTSNDIGYELSMEIVNGRPAIAHFDHSDNQIVYFLRADDVNGDNWTPANEVNIAAIDAEDIELITLSNGYPAVALFDDDDDTVVYARASDINGTSWETPFVLDDLTDDDEIALTLVNGNPAVAYYDSDNEIMYYMRATDALGDAWPSDPVVVRANDYVDSYQDMIIYQGVPTIAYQRNSEDQTQDDLALIQAAEANGTSWNDPQILIANDADTGKNNSMLVNANGNLVIATNERNTSGEYSLWVYAWEGTIEPFTVQSTTPSNGAELSTGPSQIKVEFETSVTTESAQNTSNYLLAEAGENGNFDTTSCAVPGGNSVASDDVQISVDIAIYDDRDPFIASLAINGGTPLPAGTYRLFICGTTSIETANGTKLNGGSDSTIDFTVRNAVSSLPETGFRHGKVTQLSYQPAFKAYTSTAMTLEIPKLDVITPIVGVPQSGSEWDVSWLGSSAGYLAGSAFPTREGNTVITAHVWDAYNQPGIFSELKTLKFGDQVQIHAWGATYTYEVRESNLLTRKNVNAAFQSEEYDWVTLVTCEFYSPFSREYLFRRAVRAVLVSVQ